MKLHAALVLTVASAVCVPGSSEIRRAERPGVINSAPTAGPEGIRAVVNGLANIGPRETGTDACRRAEAWLVFHWQRLGFSNVRLEDYTLEHSWSPGSVSLEELGSVPRHLDAVSADRTGSTKGSIEAPVIELPLDLEAISAKPNLRGAAILLAPSTPRSFGELHLKLGAAARQLEKVGAIALLLTFRPPGSGPKVISLEGDEEIHDFPILMLGEPDYQRLRRDAQVGALRIRLAVENHWGPRVTEHNVIAELPGRELPDEILLLHAHVDSVHNSPGALDDAVGLAMLTEALRALRDSGAVLKRTVRIVAFSGEENGLVGSRAYVARHRGKMNAIRMVMAVDGGTGPLIGFTTLKRTELLPVLSASLGRVASNFQLITDGSALHSDNAFFVLEGVPALEASFDLGDYFVHHHRVTDTALRVSPNVAAQNAHLLADAIAELANSQVVLSSRLNKQQIQAQLSNPEDADELRLLRVSF